jgi:hypothetical protein
MDCPYAPTGTQSDSKTVQSDQAPHLSTTPSRTRSVVTRVVRSFSHLPQLSPLRPWSTSAHKNDSPPPSQASVNAKSGLTPQSRQRLATPTHGTTSKSSSRTVGLSSSPPPSTHMPAPVTSLPQSERVDTLVLVRGRVQPKPVCLPKSFGCEGSGCCEDS